MAKAAHPVHPLPAYVAGEQGTKPVPPEPHRLVADVDTPVEQQVLDIPQAQRKPHVHQHHQADHLRR